MNFTIFKEQYLFLVKSVREFILQEKMVPRFNPTFCYTNIKQPVEENDLSASSKPKKLFKGGGHRIILPFLS